MSRVLYFAYGSNMDGSTLRGRRGIEWSRAAPALARGWRLVLDKPSLLGNGEAMASIVRDRGSHVWGVLFDISAADFEHLELTEGVRIDHYRRVEVVVEPSATWGAPPRGGVPAFTLASDTRDPGLRPTTRYKRLLLAGAAEHGLPEEWIERLRAIDACEESAESAAMRPVVDGWMRKPA